MARGRTLTRPAYLLLVATCFLALGGLLMIYSASSVSDYVKLGDSAYHLKKQIQFIAAGGILMYLLSWWDFRARRSGWDPRRPEVFAWAVWGVSVLGLLAVEIAGVTGGGATRWIDIGPVSVQPSEYAKLGCLLVVVVLLVQWRRREIEGKELFIRVMVALVPVVGLVMLQPDMGTTMSIVIAIFVLLGLGGVKVRWLALTGGSGAVLASLMVWVAGYRVDRVISFINPWADPIGDGYQIIQSLYAFGSGGIFGVGLGLSRQKFFYLPAAHTDFIFAVIGEELGLVGALSVVVAFIIFAYAGMRVALQAKDPFGRLMAGGITAMIVTQALMNMAAVTGLMPITGIPLPLVSAGGSSMTFTLGCIGLILAVSRHGGSGGMRLVRPTKSKGLASASTAERRRDSRPHLSRVGGGRSAARRGA
jgi:cell division protein FtsW